MSHVILDGAIARCPKCGGEDLPRKIHPEAGDEIIRGTLDDFVTCERCGHRFKIKDAVRHAT
jgi:DNA-directed RNA polymerase subunit RPC12/RpoP